MIGVKRGFIENQKNRCTAWVNFDGTTTPPTIKGSFNVSSITRTETGKFILAFKNEMKNNDYTAIISMRSNGTNQQNLGHQNSLRKDGFDISFATGGIQYNDWGCYAVIFGGEN